MKVIPNPLCGQSFGRDVPDCALRALAHMFKTDPDGILLATRLAKWASVKQGPTGRECGKLIRLLCTLHKKKTHYTNNTKKLTPLRFWKTHRRGQFILNYEEHLGLYKNGVFIDDWRPGQWDLKGWWEITNKYHRDGSFVRERNPPPLKESYINDVNDDWWNRYF